VADGPNLQLTEAVREAALTLPTAHLHKLATAIAPHQVLTPAARAAAGSAVPVAAYRAQARRICDAWANEIGVSGGALALALAATADAVAQLRATQSIDVVWTGPATIEVPVRLTREVLLDVIASASSSLILVSFAAYKVADVSSAIEGAAKRGVDVRLVLETGEADGGALKGKGAAAAFGDLAGLVSFYEWPLENREVLPGGGRGAMHAKAALADEDTALVTSGNLTEYALTANMELGLLIRGGPVPRRLARHFRQLMMDGILTPVR
jgi:phosphatidylserine/phosphatidylglycerophosphate/cardiolipin synthase-like enzyme